MFDSRPRHLAVALSILICCVALAPSDAGATTILKVDLPTMTRTSQWVVRAQVLGTEDVDLRSKGRGLFTDVKLNIVEVYKGQDIPRVYTMRLVGGTGADGTRLLIPGMPSFRAGDDVVLFLEATSLGHIPCGLGQGVWPVKASKTGVLWTHQTTPVARMVSRDARGHLTDAQGLGATSPRLLQHVVKDIYQAQQP